MAEDLMVHKYTVGTVLDARNGVINKISMKMEEDLFFSFFFNARIEDTHSLRIAGSKFTQLMKENKMKPIPGKNFPILPVSKVGFKDRSHWKLFLFLSE